MNNLLVLIQLSVAIPIILYVLGIVLMIVEIFAPGFGVFGISGIASFVSGIVLRLMSGGSVWEILLVIIVALVLLTFMMIFAVKSAKNGRLSKSAVILTEQAIPHGQTEGTNDYSFLLGKQGKTTTFLRPVGKAKIDGQLYEVISDNSAILEKDSKIKVIEVEGQRIVVCKFVNIVNL